MNRIIFKIPIFHSNRDYYAFEKILWEAGKKFPMRLLAYCLMPNQWHLVLWPYHDKDLSHYLAWISQTHSQRWHEHRGIVGSGHLYQGRFKSFPVQTDKYLLTVCRYVERNPVRANLTSQSEDWKWSSATPPTIKKLLLHEWPVKKPNDWLKWVNTPQTLTEERAIKECIQRGKPYGSNQWVGQIAKSLGLTNTLRPRGRPKKGSDPF